MSKVTKSSGNVFKDLGFDEAEAKTLLLRADLMIAIEKKLGEDAKTQAQIGKLLGIAQPRVSDLLKRRFNKFSLDMLIKLAIRAGLPVPDVLTYQSAHRVRYESRLINKYSSQSVLIASGATTEAAQSINTFAAVERISTTASFVTLPWIKGVFPDHAKGRALHEFMYSETIPMRAMEISRPSAIGH